MAIKSGFCTFCLPAFWGFFIVTYLYFNDFRAFLVIDSIVYFILLPILESVGKLKYIFSGINLQVLNFVVPLQHK